MNWTRYNRPFLDTINLYLFPATLIFSFISLLHDLLFQPCSQGSVLPTSTERARERDPGWGLSRVSQNKITRGGIKDSCCRSLTDDINRWNLWASQSHRIVESAIQGCFTSYWSILKGKSLYVELVLKVSMYCMFDSGWKNLALICPSPNHLFVISQILKDITRVSLSRSVGTGRREPWKQNCCYFPTTPPHLYCSPSNGHSYCLPSTSIPIVLPPPPFLLPSLLVWQR